MREAQTMAVADTSFRYVVDHLRRVFRQWEDLDDDRA